LSIVAKRLGEETLPRLGVDVDQEGLRWLTAEGAKDLPQFVSSHQQTLQLLTSQTAFLPKAQQPAGRQTILWTRHWHTKTFAPLLCRCDLDLRAGQTAIGYQVNLDLQAEEAKAMASRPEHRSTLAGLLIRIIAATVEELERPRIRAIAWEQGLQFYRDDYRPFCIEGDASASTTSPDHRGLGLEVIAGRGVGEQDADRDLRRLERPFLAPAHLHPDARSGVRFVIQDRDMGKYAVTLALSCPPPQPLRSLQEKELIESAPVRPAAAVPNEATAQGGEAASIAIPGWASPWLIASLFIAFAVAVWKTL
jgi:hypothetical protein